MRPHRSSKSRKVLQRMRVKPVITLDRSELDKKIFDHVLNTLYNNADKNMLHIDQDIYATSGITLPRNESERIWEIMISTGFVSPVIGFGNAGKVELTKSGYQLMSQFGGYSQYLNSLKDAQQPQTIILPIQVQDDGDDTEAPAALPEPQKEKAARQIIRKSKHGNK